MVNQKLTKKVVYTWCNLIVYDFVGLYGLEILYDMPYALWFRNANDAVLSYN